MFSAAIMFMQPEPAATRAALTAISASIASFDDPPGAAGLREASRAPGCGPLPAPCDPARWGFPGWPAVRDPALAPAAAAAPPAPLVPALPAIPPPPGAAVPPEAVVVALPAAPIPAA